MNRIIPLFPLQLVVFPDEELPIHVFEDRYLQLIKDCKRGKLNFGIPVFFEGKIEFGTEMIIKKIVRTYENGVMDIVCKGKRVFKVEKFFNPIPNKLYAGGEVTFMPRKNDGTQQQKQKVIDLIYQLYNSIDVTVASIDIETFSSFSFAHKIGMNIEDEYKLIQIKSEHARLRYLEKHLTKVLPVLKQVNRTKELIQMNGHFKNLDPLDFSG
ncbi:LON peptidase substrate-binding domain-containing protein [Galbibacter sp. PAP.153]|uniref:LON peptidase substrate-binding domain-containing protein n=1 Tax=Galbibacter sp. PAP.153 TaxID=3104623 RepID=UPI00300AE20D